MNKTTWTAAIGAAALGLAATTALVAQGMPTEAPGRVDPTRITGGTYQADPAHSMVQWRINHLGFNDYFGIFGDVSGTLQLDPAKPGEARVDVTIPVASVTVPSAGLRDQAPRGIAFCDWRFPMRTYGRLFLLGALPRLFYGFQPH